MSTRYQLFAGQSSQLKKGRIQDKPQTSSFTVNNREDLVQGRTRLNVSQRTVNEQANDSDVGIGVFC